MSRDKALMTPAARALKRMGVSFTEHPYTYVEHGGKRGFFVGLDPKDLVRVLKPTPVRVGYTSVYVHDDVEPNHT